MPKLSDVIDLKTGKYIKKPMLIIQDVTPVDDVSNSILEHMRYQYQMISLTPIDTGPHGGRILLLFQYAAKGKP